MKAEIFQEHLPVFILHESVGSNDVGSLLAYREIDRKTQGVAAAAVVVGIGLYLAVLLALPSANSLT